MKSKPHQICTILDWDTQFFGKRIARLTQPSLLGGVAEAAIRWCHQQEIACLYYLAPSTEIESIRLAEKLGFNLTDIRMTFELLTTSAFTPVSSPQIRPAQANDIPGLKEIARTAYHNTRFFNDSHLPTHLCEKLYMTWIENSCNGYAQAVWVADIAGEPVGFITCHLDGERGQIGLVGIHLNHQGQGWGNKLVLTALSWFIGQNCTSVKVITQGSNLAAQRLYAKCGFSIASVELWYHRWFTTLREEVHP
jgi:dTDP-4-amino-4,6-dideoxy-D-galactose acyltransferase